MVVVVPEENPKLLFPILQITINEFHTQLNNMSLFGFAAIWADRVDGLSPRIANA